jgi:hypothetical protein
MPYPFAQNCNGGVDGADVTTGEASPNTFDTVAQNSGQPDYSNVQSHSAPLAIRWVAPAPTASSFVAFGPGLGSTTIDVYARFYVFVPSLPADNNWYPMFHRTNTNAACAGLRILSSGIISARDATNTSCGIDGSVAVATNQWVRIECRVLPHTSAGTMEWRLYNNADSSTITDSNSGTGFAFGANIDQSNFGFNVSFPAAGLTVYFDDLQIATSGWIGPTVISPTVAWLTA